MLFNSVVELMYTRYSRGPSQSTDETADYLLQPWQRKRKDFNSPFLNIMTEVEKGSPQITNLSG